MAFGLTIKTTAILCSRLSEILDVPEEKVTEAMKQINHKKIKKITQNKLEEEK